MKILEREGKSVVWLHQPHPNVITLFILKVVHLTTYQLKNDIQ